MLLPMTTVTPARRPRSDPETAALATPARTRTPRPAARPGCGGGCGAAGEGLQEPLVKIAAPGLWEETEKAGAAGGAGWLHDNWPRPGFGDLREGAAGLGGIPAGGMARMAAMAPLEGESKGVEYFRLPVRSVLNRVVSGRVGFPWSINPYRGCEFGCHYCYARYTHEYMELEPQEFERKIYVKEDAAARLRRELTPERVAGQHIAIGAATDPYQPAERRFGVTRAILEVLLDYARRRPGELSLSITTKSNLVLKDADLLGELARRGRLHINMSVTTVNTRLARVLEPRAPRPDLRLGAVRELNAAGIPAGVFAAPVLPGITDDPTALEALVAAAAEAGARFLCANVVFLMPSSQKAFFPFLERRFPRLRKQYRKWFRASGYAPEAYRARISSLMRDLRARYGLPGSWPRDPAGPQPADYAALAPQLALPFASSWSHAAAPQSPRRAS